MRPAGILLSCLTAVAIVIGASAQPNDASAQEKRDAGASTALPACISVGTDARYVPYGYNHVVLLKNGCSKAATCTVSTDVNPQATTVEVAAAAAVEVLTFTASPAQTFSARVTCKLH
ncbi:MAG: hypothetical protein JWP87_2295 [Labilithrix sp.]|nr:hypothetical protein [Labilithrix sp.]